MSKLVAAAAASIAFMVPAAASAQQMMPGAELYGQQVQVVAANGDTNRLMFQPDGTVHITSTNGQSAHGRWFVRDNSNMCIAVGAATECWQYRAPFEAGRALSMVSDCGATTSWTALGVNQPAPVQRRAGERG